MPSPIASPANLSFRRVAESKCGPNWSQAWQVYSQLSSSATDNGVGFPKNWHSTLADKGVGATVGALAMLIEQGFGFVRRRTIDKKPLVAYQLPQQKLSVFATLEQILIACLDVLDDPASPDKRRNLATSEIARVTNDLCDLVVDHFGGVGYASYNDVPPCQVANELAINSRKRSVVG